MAGQECDCVLRNAKGLPLPLLLLLLLLSGELARASNAAGVGVLRRSERTGAGRSCDPVRRGLRSQWRFFGSD